MKKTSALAGLGFVLLLGSSAQADTITVTDVEITGYDYTVGIRNPVSGQHEDAYDAAIILTIDGQRVLVNCDDLWHNINIGRQTLTFNVLPFSSQSQAPNPTGGYYSATQIAEMSWLLDESDLIWSGQQAAAPGTTVEEDLAALQLASWQIGNPTTIYTPSSFGVANLASTYAADAVGKGPLPGMAVEQLLSTNGSQSQLFDPPPAVPEPATWTLLLFGLIGLGSIYAHRRKYQPRASHAGEQRAARQRPDLT
jgi:hypothetical protein